MDPHILFLRIKVECSNDEVAYGRKRRSASTSPAATNRNDRVFEVSMTTLVKFDAEPTLKKGILANNAHGIATS